MTTADDKRLQDQVNAANNAGGLHCTYCGEWGHLNTPCPQADDTPPDTRSEMERCGAERRSDPNWNHTWIPCVLDRGHDGDHFSTSGCAGSEMRWPDTRSEVPCDHPAEVETRTSIDEALAKWEARGPTSLTVALLADALYGVRDVLDLVEKNPLGWGGAPAVSLARTLRGRADWIGGNAETHAPYYNTRGRHAGSYEACPYCTDRIEGDRG